jgi:YggT family protein
VRILCSWVPDLYRYKIVQFISFCVDPYLNLFRKFIPPIGMIDISPIIAIIFLNILEGFVFYLLR